MALTDASGNVVNTYQYDPFGNIVAGTETVDNPWKFAGAYFDAASGLYKIGLRYYDPSVGRWTQQDAQIDFSDPRAWNRYAYTGNDPINFVDPSGACGEPSAGEFAGSEGTAALFAIATYAAIVSGPVGWVAWVIVVGPPAFGFTITVFNYSANHWTPC